MSKQNRATHSHRCQHIVELSVHRPSHYPPHARFFGGRSSRRSGVQRHLARGDDGVPKILNYSPSGFRSPKASLSIRRTFSAWMWFRPATVWKCRFELSSRRFMGLKERRRALAGRTGCGVCGVEQLNDIGKPVEPLPFTQTFNLANLDQALAHLNDLQPIGQFSGCTHAAAWVPAVRRDGRGLEDVGRHVALDKLLGRRAEVARCGSRAQRWSPAAPATRWCKSRRCAASRSCLRSRRRRRWRWRWPSAAT